MLQHTAGHLETIYLPPDLFSDSTLCLAFPKTEKTAPRSSATKAGLMPFKRTITNGVDKLPSKMNEVSLERQSSSNKSLCLSHAVIFRDSLALLGSFEIKGHIGSIYYSTGTLTHTWTRTQGTESCQSAVRQAVD